RSRHVLREVLQMLVVVRVNDQLALAPSRKRTWLLRRSWKETAHWLAVRHDDQLLVALEPIEQVGKMCLNLFKGRGLHRYTLLCNQDNENSAWVQHGFGRIVQSRSRVGSRLAHLQSVHVPPRPAPRIRSCAHPTAHSRHSWIPRPGC